MADPSPAEVPIDLPTGEPIPAPTPTPAAGADEKKPTAATTTAAAAALAARLRGADAFLAHLQRCLATPGGVDTTLLFACYTSRLSGALLSALARALLARRRRSPTARELLALVLTNLPAKTAAAATTTTTTVVLTSSAAPSAAAPAARLAALLGARLKNLGDLASEARTIARLWALLGMYSWARRLVQQLLAPSPGGGEGGLAAAVSWAQLLSCAAFQYLENGAYLSGRGVLGWTPRQQARAYVVGARWLAVYTGLEIGKLLAGFAARRRASSPSAAGEKGEAEAEEERARAEAARRSLAINLAWTPLTLHWSTEGGFLSDAAVGLGGCIPGVIQMRKLWRETAQP